LLTGYLLEKVLSIDMIFVVMLIFDYFRVSAKSQHTVLFWGPGPGSRTGRARV